MQRQDGRRPNGMLCAEGDFGNDDSPLPLRVISRIYGPMESATLAAPGVRPITRSSTTSIPWHGWVAVGAVACLPVGLLWDISWHSTIGRDTFWTPAHIVIQLGGMVPAFLFAWLALRTTFWGSPDERASSARIFGVWAPLGAWVTMWGAVAMATSAPFDDWWHNTYGLDVKIVSPPHSVLGVGMLGVTAGMLLFVFSRQNRARGHSQKTGALLCALAAGVMLTLFSDFLTEFTFPNQQHSGEFYVVTAAVYPFALVLTARASQLRWPATIAAAVYMGVMMLMIWILPLFPAHPKLAPIYNPVSHMVPPAFPFLLVLPACGLDWLLKRFRASPPAPASGKERPAENRLSRFGRHDWLLAPVLAAVFLALFIPTQWLFSTFLLSDGADNWFFARSGHWPYFSVPGAWMNHFWVEGPAPFDGPHLAAAFVIALISARTGLWCGNYLLKVQR